MIVLCVMLILSNFPRKSFFQWTYHFCVLEGYHSTDNASDSGGESFYHFFSEVFFWIDNAYLSGRGGVSKFSYHGAVLLV